MGCAQVGSGLRDPQLWGRSLQTGSQKEDSTPALLAPSTSSSPPLPSPSSSVGAESQQLSDAGRPLSEAGCWETDHTQAYFRPPVFAH